MHSPVGLAETHRARAMSAACSVALFAITSIGMADEAHAAAPSVTPAPSELFGVHPVQEGRTTLPGGHFNLALVPGQRISDGIVVVNFSSHALRFHVYGADLLTAIGGGLAPAQPTATMREVGAWIAVSAPVIMIAAHSQSTDAFSIRVPATVSAGQHLGAVVAAADVGVTGQGTPIEARAALIAVVTVPGSVRPAAMLTALSGSATESGRFGFRITLSNTGNVLLTYVGSLTIDDSHGRMVTRLPLTPTNAYVVPSGRVPLAAMWREPAPPADSYRAQATITIFANGKPVGTLSSQSLAVLFPSVAPSWFVVVLALAILVMILLAAWAWRRFVRWQNPRGVRRVLGPGPVG